MSVWHGSIDDVLRAGIRPPDVAAPHTLLPRLVAFVCVFGMTYGLVMGSYSGWGGNRLWQACYSAAKVPILLLGTFAICLPSFFVLNVVAGLRSDFPAVLRALLTAQAGMTMVLCSLAPFTVIWYLSPASYNAAVLFNGAAFAIASLATQANLRRLYHPLVQSHRKHAFLLRVWLVLYIFVGIQLGWLLRPFIGLPGTAVELFRADAWGNAYIALFHHFASLFR
jgi:hypothetical protein